MKDYNVYVGARYVPIFDGEWDNKKEYEPLVIVSYNGNSYTSKTYVPIGVDINDDKYWGLTGNYNAQVESYRKEVASLKEIVDTSVVTNINAILNGVDNTGKIEVSETLNKLIENNYGKRIYIPAGKYLLSNPIIIPSNGVMLICDSNAEFYSNTSIPYLIQIGSGETPNNLLKMGVIGGNWNGELCTNCVIYVNNVQYSTIVSDVFINNFTTMGLSVGSNINTSTQFYGQNITVIAKAGENIEPTATGVRLVGTDNYIDILNIGRCLKGLTLSGSGNLLTNVHTWWGAEISRMPLNREKLFEARSITNSGNNRIANLHIDNPYIGIYLSPYNNHFSVTNVVFNYDTLNYIDKNWEQCMVYYNDFTGNNRSSFDIRGVCVTGLRSGRHIKSIKGDLTNNINIRNPIFNNFEYRGQTQLVDALPIEDEINNVMRYYQPYPITSVYESDVKAGTYLFGYIKAVNSSYKIKLRSYSNASCDFNINVNDKTVSVTQGRLTRFSKHCSIIFGTTITQIDGDEYFPIYIKLFEDGNWYTPITLELISTSGCGAYFKKNGLFSNSNAVENVNGIECDLYTFNAVKRTSFTTSQEIQPNNAFFFKIDLSNEIKTMEHLSSILSVHCNLQNLDISISDVTGNVVTVIIHNNQTTIQTITNIVVQFYTELN